MSAEIQKTTTIAGEEHIKSGEPGHRILQPTGKIWDEFFTPGDGGAE